MIIFNFIYLSFFYVCFSIAPWFISSSMVHLQIIVPSHSSFLCMHGTYQSSKDILKLRLLVGRLCIQEKVLGLRNVFPKCVDDIYKPLWP